MKGLKFIIQSWRRMAVFFWIGVVFSLIFAVLPFFFHEEASSEDYLFPKVFIFFPSFFMMELGVICGCRDIAANRLVRSFPIAKELYTKSVPTFVVLLMLGVSAVSVTAYFIFLGIIGAEEKHFADTLIIGAIITAPVFASASFFTNIPGGGMFCVYIAVLPIVIMATVGSDTVMREGFGLSLPAAAAVSAALIIVSAALMFVIANRRFKKSNIRINNMAMNYETK